MNMGASENVSTKFQRPEGLPQSLLWILFGGLLFAPLALFANPQPSIAYSNIFQADSRNVAQESRSESAQVSLDGREVDGVKGFAVSDGARLGSDEATNIMALEHPIRTVWQPTSGFGASVTYNGRVLRGHLGQDYGAPTGTIVRAVAEGEVVLRRPDPRPGEGKGMGNVLILRHELADDQSIYSLYGHLSRMDVREGRELSVGDPIGAVGETGFATGPHLHFEIKEGPSMPAVGDGYAGVTFAGATFRENEITYHDPFSYIEGKVTPPSDGTNARVAGTGGLGLRLRGSASLDAAILALMPDGSEITPLDSDTTRNDGHEWLKVEYSGTEGWASARYISFFDADSEESLAAPTDLTQFDGSGGAMLAKGATVTGRDVVFEGDAPGTGQLSVRLEVRLQNLSSGNTRTSPGRTGPGGRFNRVTVEGLRPGDYTWKMRAVDERGRVSDWRTFAEENSAAFSVRSGTTPSALFVSEPPFHVIPGETVTFDASASKGSVTPLSYAWEFHDGQTESGSSVERSFSETGTFPVTLTVTDNLGRTSTRTDEVTVLSSDLDEAVTRLVDRAISVFDSMEERTTALASEVEFYDQRLNDEQYEVISGAIMDIAVAGISELPAVKLDLPDADTPVDEVIDLVAEKFVRQLINDGSNTVVNEVASLLRIGENRSSLPENFRELARSTFERHQQDLLALRDEVLANAADLSASESDRIVNELNAKNATIEKMWNSYERVSALPITFATLLREDEESWMWKMAQISHLIGFTAAEWAVKLKGGWILGVVMEGGNRAAAAGDRIEENKREADMLATSVGYLWESFTVAGMIRNEAEKSLGQLASGVALEPPSGTMTIYDSVSGKTGFLTGRFLIEKAWTDVVIENTGSSTARYWLSAFHPKEFSTVSLPYGIVSLSHDYEIQVIAEERDIELTPGETEVIRFTYFVDGNGIDPTETDRLFNYALMAQNEDGHYVVALNSRRFDWESPVSPQPASVSTLSTINETESEEVIPFVTPLSVTAKGSTGESDYRMVITYRNPFDVVAPIELRVPDSPEWEVLSAEGASVTGGGSIVKSTELRPGEIRAIELELWVADQDAANAVPPVYFDLWHSLDEKWVEFHQSGRDIAVDFHDDQLKQAVKDALGATEPLEPSDVRNLTHLDLTGDPILSLRGLEHARNLYVLRAPGGQIASLGPLSNLRNLDEVNLRGNRLSTVGTLLTMANAGAFDSNSRIDLRGNPLDLDQGTQNYTDLRQIREQGIFIRTAPTGSFDGWREVSFAPQDLYDPSVTGAAAVPYADGTENLMKYALGLHPSEQASSKMPKPTFQKTGESIVRLSLQRHTVPDDIIYEIEGSDSLSDWRIIARSEGRNPFAPDHGEPVTFHAEPHPTHPEDEIIKVIYDDAVDDAPNFYRLRIRFQQAEN